MIALTYKIKLLAPVLATRSGAGEENSAITHDYIPGTLIRGALVALYLRQNKGVHDLARDDKGKRLFIDGNCCFLNGYLVDQLGKRSLPRPLSLRVARDELESPHAIIYDLALEEHKVNKPKIPPKNFMAKDEKAVYFLEPEKVIQVHNSSDSRMIKKSGTSFMFRYEALATSQDFSAAIVSEDKNLLVDIKHLLDHGKFSLGRSRHAQYGNVLIIETKIEEQPWREYERDSQPQGRIILTLLSDTILRSGNGQPTDDIHEGLSLANPPLEEFKQTITASGFNTKWGLPLPQSLALRAGSVFVFAKGQIHSALMDKWVNQGIGERRVEGYGRLAVGWQKDKQYIQIDSVIPGERMESGPAGAATRILTVTSRKLAGEMAKRQLKAQLEWRLGILLAGSIIENPPNNAQLFRMRLVMQKTWRMGSWDSLEEYLQDIRKTARDQLETAHVVIGEGKITKRTRLVIWKGKCETAPGKITYEGFLKDVQDGTIWKENFGQDMEVPSVAGVLADLDKAIEIEYVSRLIDALLQKTAEGGT